MNNFQMRLKKTHFDAIIPKYATEGSVGLDLHSLFYHRLHPGHREIIRTGISVEVPAGLEIQIRQRSGLSVKYPNYFSIGVGTIDQDFRGEIMIPIMNTGIKDWYIVAGDRIVQAIISPIIKVDFIEVDELNETKRGAGGFGHTGIKNG